LPTHTWWKHTAPPHLVSPIGPLAAAETCRLTCLEAEANHVERLPK
jgi:hypothetical protein